MYYHRQPKIQIIKYNKNTIHVLESNKLVLNKIDQHKQKKLNKVNEESYKKLTTLTNMSNQYHKKNNTINTLSLGLTNQFCNYISIELQHFYPCLVCHDHFRKSHQYCFNDHYIYICKTCQPKILLRQQITKLTIIKTICSINHILTRLSLQDLNQFVCSAYVSAVRQSNYKKLTKLPFDLKRLSLNEFTWHRIRVIPFVTRWYD